MKILRKSVVYVVLLAMPAALFAQINWTEHAFTDSFDFPMSVYAIDLDNDEDVDVLGAGGMYTQEVRWWENDGSSPPIFTEHNISGGSWTVFAIDLDDDNDIDILGTSGSYITWWENDGASPPIFTEHTVNPDSFAALSIYAIDMDDDNDIDVLGAAMSADEITWWENDGNENFTEHTISNSFDGAYSVYAIDVEPDGDIDILGAARNADEITWWENDGNENWTEHTISNSFDGALSVYAIDLDDDEDIDVLGAAMNADDITWWENDGNENFTEHTINGSYNGALSVYALDLDDDGDKDVLGAAVIADEVTWWENDGDENFTEHTIANNYDAARSVYAIDLNNDNDVDILAVTTGGDNINWWESDLLDMYDVGPVSIDIDSLVPEDTTFNPQATVKNYGTNNESFLVTCVIDPGDYNRNRTVNNLAPGDSTLVTFLAEFTFESGSYTVTVYTRLTDDENPANDTLVKVIQTYVPGVAEERVNTPKTFSFKAPTINRGKAHIELVMAVETEVDLLVYDAIGRLSETLISERLSTGNHKLNVNLNLPAGVYFYNLKTGTGENIIKKFLIVE